MSRPNILFIVADDLNSWIGALGRHPDVRTPAIDALAGRGTLFTRAYCSAPYCNASRMGVFTGCLPATTGIYQNQPLWEAVGRRTTFLEQLGAHGYHRAGAGKVFHGAYDYARAGRERLPAASWIEHQNRDFLWARFDTIPPEPMPPARPLNRMFDFDRFDEVSPWNHHFDWGVLPDDRAEDMPDAATCRAIAGMLADPPPQPFFLAAGLYRPHLPWYVPKAFFDLYPRERVSLPFVRADDLDDVPDIARSWALSPPDHELVTGHGQWRDAVQGYLASISYCDAMIGRLMAALDASPARDDTIVVLWGDNGFHLGEKLHWRKFVLWEEATRVPLVIVPPRGQAVVPRVDAPVSLVDLFPTLFELCGLPEVEGVDGRSLLGPMTGRTVRETPAVTTWLAGNHSLRQGQWRYTRYAAGGEELYDHSADPHEWNNLAGLPRFEPQLAGFRSLLAGRDG